MDHGHFFTRKWPAGPTSKHRDKVIYYSYKADRARCTLRGIDEQGKQAKKAADGQAPVKRDRFIQIQGAKVSTATAPSHPRRPPHLHRRRPRP